MKKRLAIVVDNELDNDVRVLKEINMVKEHEFEIHVLCFGFKGENQQKHSFPVHRLNIKRKLKNILYFFNLITPFYEWLWTRHVSRVLSKYDFDAIHVHDLYMSKAVYRSKQRLNKNIPLILDLHENYPYAYQLYSWVNKFPNSIFTRPKKWIKLESHYLGYADRIIVLSNTFKNKLLEKYVFLEASKIFVLPNIIDPSSLSGDRTLKRTDDRITFLYFGGIALRRGVIDVIQAFEALQDVRKDIRLLLLGPVDKADREVFFDALDKLNDEVVTYKSWIPAHELDQYMAIADVGLSPIHVNPQHESGLANKIFQYMYGGLPLLVSNCQPQREMIEMHDIGYVFHDQSSLKEGILFFLTNMKQREEMGKRAYSVVREKYLSRNFEEKLVEFIESTIELKN